MKILMVGEGIYPDAPGGTGRIISGMAHTLAGKGHEVIVIVRRLTPHYSPLERLSNMRIYRFAAPISGENHYFLWPFYSLLRAYSLARYLIRKEGAFDVINTHHPCSGYLILKHFARRSISIHDFHAPIAEEISIDHQNNLFLPAMIRLTGLLETAVLRTAKHVTVESKFMANKCCHRRGEALAGKIALIPGGVDVSCFHPVSDEAKRKIRRLLAIPLDKTVILTVRRLVKRTGVDELIRAIECLRHERDDFLLVVVGEGYMRPMLEELVRQADLGNWVRLVGFVSDEELPRYYQASDLFVMPTTSLEGFGLSTIEALASGIPVLGTSVGGTPEILEPLHPGWVIHKADGEGIHRALTNFLSHPQDYCLPKTKIRAYAEANYAWDVVANRFLRLISEISMSD